MLALKIFLGVLRDYDKHAYKWRQAMSANRVGPLKGDPNG